MSSEDTSIGLRERKSRSSEGEQSSANSSKTQDDLEIVENYINAIVSKIPEKYKAKVEQFVPHLLRFIKLCYQMIPFICQVYDRLKEYYEKLLPYKPHLLLPSFVGLIMCFFGGHFLTLIAAVEAYRLVGYETTVQCIRDLIDDFNKFVVANKKDDNADLDGNGKKDVLELTPQQLVARKTLLFLRTVDPKRITNAIKGINSGFVAVIATLKLQFVKAITLGSAIAHTMEVPANRYVLPLFEKLFPDEYRRWAEPLMSYAIHSFAISIAWTIQRFISAFHSAIRGGLLFSRNILKYLSEMDIYHLDDKDTILDEVVGYGLAFLGFAFQVLGRFSLPFPLNILLFPFTILEYLLVWTVTRS